jgi:hypothetical protein
MGANQRSRGAAGRSIDRPAVTALVALVALLALGTATALFTPSSVAAQQAAPSPAAPGTPQEPTNPAPSGPPPTDPPVDEGQVVQEQDPLATEPIDPEWSPTATYDSRTPAEAPAPEPTASSPPADGGPQAGNGDASQEPPPEPEPEAPSQPTGDVAAQNVSRVLQAVWQVQVGCRRHCRGTSQSQSASQRSETKQDATAVAPEGEASGAAAVNQSSTIQFTWQMQLGCVAFCWDTSMNQSASQEAETTQIATAVSAAAALSLNLAETLQYVWQHQEGCELECYGVNESQSLSQHQTTNQSATATGPPYPTSAEWRPDQPDPFVLAWLTAYARNIGATLQMIYQYEEASCLEYCDEEALMQLAAQIAATDQTATAGDVPEPGSGGPPGPEPPSAGPPAPAGGAPQPEQLPAVSGALASAGAARTATLLRSSRDFAAGGRGPAAPRARDGGGAAYRPDSRSSIRMSTSASSGYAAAAVGTRPEEPAPPAGSGTGAGSHAQASTPANASPSEPRKPQDAPSSAPALDRSAASEASKDPSIPWLPAGLLLLAALAVVQSLRFRPGFRA